MRLINTETGAFEEFFDLETTPPYAILSHTWDRKEQTYQEVLKIQQQYSFQESPPTPHPVWDPDSGLSEKVRRACEIARRDGYRYIWVDSSCIDKTSSSELSEAINSMYNWYRGAQVCYAFLKDVPSDEDVKAWGSRFRNSMWFTRGWTLQELIAPRLVVFLSEEWECLGTKAKLAEVIEEITSIDPEILTYKRPLSDESVAHRMRWASNRRTTRVEDEAYCLLGIFGITMFTLYGEGRYAFRRLQEEILRRIPDQSLFTWGGPFEPFPMTPSKLQVDFDRSEMLFAPSPRCFASLFPGRTTRATGDLVNRLNLPAQKYTDTPYGIRTKFCLLPLETLNPNLSINYQNHWLGNASSPASYLLLLRSQHSNDPPHLLSRLCFLHSEEANVEYLYVLDNISLGPGRLWMHPIFTLPLNDLVQIKEKTGTDLPTKTVYLPHPKPSVIERKPFQASNNNSLNLMLPTWIRDATLRSGYTVTDIQGPAEDDPNASGPSFSLSRRDHPSFNIYIHYRHIGAHYTGRETHNIFMIDARVWIVPSGQGALPRSDAIWRSPPYASVAWVGADESAWKTTLPTRNITLMADFLPDDTTLRLDLDLVPPSRCNVLFEVLPALPRSPRASQLIPLTHWEFP